jgi:hypothetical protein
MTGQGAGGKTTVWAWVGLELIRLVSSTFALQGSTGEEKWNPDMEIGVDWKSLVRSGLLPITTDFFPDGHSLIHDFLSAVSAGFVTVKLVDDV